MTIVLADHVRRAAHGRHKCALCGRTIPARAHYNDRRVADSGTVYTWREHLACGHLVDAAVRFYSITDDDDLGPTGWLELVTEYQAETGQPPTGWPEPTP